ncbi:hypothetical protein ACM9HB_35800, partial [Streptomyces sp. JAC128]
MIGRGDWLGRTLGRLGSLEGTDAFPGIRPSGADHGQPWPRAGGTGHGPAAAHRVYTAHRQLAAP